MKSKPSPTRILFCSAHFPTLYDARTTHSRDVLADVSDRYSLAVLAPPIPRTVKFAEASASGATVLAGRKEQGCGCLS